MKKYADMSNEELSAAKQALDAEMKKLREKKLAAQDPVERRKLEAGISQIRDAKRNIQAEQDTRPIALLGEGHVLGVSGIEPQSKMGNIGGSPEPAAKKSKK